MFGNLEGAVQRGRGGKEKGWTDCVQSDVRASGITGEGRDAHPNVRRAAAKANLVRKS